MSAYPTVYRPDLAHTGERRQGDRRRPSQYPSAFVAQVLSTHRRPDAPVQEIVTPRNPAVEAYNSGSKVTERRMPAGYGWTETI